jgi:hypothetical protein
MDNFKNKKEPKKIKMPPLLDRSELYDTLSFEGDTLPDSTEYKTFWKTYNTEDEDYSENNSESISKLESDQRN